MTVNKVILVGHLGADPDLKNLPSGSSLVSFNLATNESYTDKSGNKVKNTEWHRISFFGRQAEVIHEYCRKGSMLYVEGSIHTRKYQDKDGNDRYATDIKGFRFNFIGGRSDGGGSGGEDSPGGAPRPADGNFSDMDDVPF